jgi:hypothetical protein
VKEDTGEVLPKDQIKKCYGKLLKSLPPRSGANVGTGVAHDLVVCLPIFSFFFFFNLAESLLSEAQSAEVADDCGCGRSEECNPEARRVRRTDMALSLSNLLENILRLSLPPVFFSLAMRLVIRLLKKVLNLRSIS